MIKPLGNRVIIEPEAKEEQTASGIFIAVKDEPAGKGKIISAGESNLVKKGDIVLFGKYSPNEIEVNGKKYLIIKEEDLLAVL